MGALMLLLLISLAFSQDAPLPAFEALLPETPSFQTAKKRVYELQIDRPVTFYCTCKFEDKVVDLKSCLMGDIEAARALRTEVEHVVPASVIGKTRDCWAEAPSTGRTWPVTKDARARYSTASATSSPRP